MTIQTKKELAVAALQNGIVIDHIPCDSLFKVVNILGIQNMENGVFIGNNLSSRSMGRKGLIKIADIPGVSALTTPLLTACVEQ